MGPFILIHKSKRAAYCKALPAASKMFRQMGLAAAVTVEDRNYTIIAFPKRQTGEFAYKRFPTGDFVMVAGTLVYAGAVGTAAAVAFYRDYDAGNSPRHRTMGHYALILRKRGVTHIILDRFGGFHLFSDLWTSVVSSSLLAITSTRNGLTLSPQSVYEYVFNGVVSGDNTLFDEIILAPINSTIRVLEDGFDIVREPLCIPKHISCAPIQVSFDRSMALLDDYFAAIATNFGDRVTTALSGGYDSRLILAFLRRHAIHPRIYVYGSADDPEISLVRAVANGEGFGLEIMDKEREITVEPDEFGEVAYQNFLAADGYGWAGIFNNGAERQQRAYRVSGDAIALNGGGGEIWRNFFYLPDRSYRVREVLWSFYSQFDPRMCTLIFNEEDYFRQLEEKLARLIGEPLKSLPRPLIEWLYHNFRCRAWDCRVNSMNSMFGHAGLPFLERPLTEHASTIPLSWKNHGAYEAELIRRADARLASYPTVYGHNFSHPPPFARRLADYGTYLRPPWLRRFSYRVKHRMLGRRDLSKYLQNQYMDIVLPGGVKIMSAFFHVDRVADPAQLARILTLEYVARELGTLSLGGFA